ncbi:hypothetical protein SDC9_102419 [bioreactor metagenome]|uniref:Uncharacterized protein n=1 Tax=bioreactor metagenome TaxID=1076179 RepID=A0A645AQT0_9ZZZZ
MREQFQKHCGYVGCACFGVRAVPEVAPRPVGFKFAPYIVYDLIHHEFGEVARRPSRLSVSELFVVKVCHVNAERTHYGISPESTGIGMEGKGQVQRNIESFLFGQYRRTARQPVHPYAAAGIIVRIVIFAFCTVVNGIRHARPLHPVTCTFGIAGVTADFRRITDLRDHCLFRRLGIRTFGVFPFKPFGMGHPGYISHSSAYLYRVGGNDPAGMAAFVGECDLVPVPFVEIKISQEDPGAAAHLLVDTKIGSPAFVIYAVERIVAAVLYGLIRDIDSIFSLFGNIGTPFRETLLSAGYCFCLPGRSHPERILTI